MSSAKRIVLCTAALVGGLGFFEGAVAADEQIPTYTARYEVKYKGRNVGESTHSLAWDGKIYRFESVTTARGIARLLRPRPVIEQSSFEQHGDTLRPHEFRLEDGTRRGEDNLLIEFDWTAGIARIDTSEGPVELPLEPGVHDRATLQLALMLELEAERFVGPHRLIDDTAIKTYHYDVDGEDTVATPSGTHKTIKVIQRREGSSRHTIIWLAPAFSYLPVKIEQRRDDEVLTTLLLESVQGFE